MQQQRNGAGGASQCGSGSAESDLGREHVQGQHYLPLPAVSIPDPHPTPQNQSTQENALIECDEQDRRDHPRLHNLHPTRDLPGLARRARPAHGVRRRREAVPLAARVAGGAGAHLHRVHLRARQRALAAHGVGRRGHDRAGPGQWVRQERRRHQRHGARLVRLRAADHRDHWPARHDPEHYRAGSVDG